MEFDKGNKIEIRVKLNYKRTNTMRENSAKQKTILAQKNNDGRKFRKPEMTV